MNKEEERAFRFFLKLMEPLLKNHEINHEARGHELLDEVENTLYAYRSSKKGTRECERCAGEHHYVDSIPHCDGSEFHCNDCGYVWCDYGNN